MAFSAPALSATAEVRIEGISGDLLNNARARLAIRNAAAQGEQPEYMFERLHERAADDIRSALQPYGYYSPEITGEFAVSGEAGARRVRATYQVAPGPQTTIREVRVEIVGDGAEDPVLQQRRKELPIAAGDALRHARYARAKDLLLSAAFARGYFDVGYRRAQIRVMREQQRADIVLELDTGSRFLVGDIRLEQDTLDGDVLRRYLTIHEGEPFAPSALLESQFQLMELGYFSRVDIEPIREEAEDNRMPVRIVPEYLPSQRYSAGIGYGTDTGARISLETDFRRINRSGHWIESDIRVAERRSNVGATYNIPLGNIPGERLSFSSTYSDERFEDGESSRYSVGVSLSRKPGSWKRRTYLDYSTERYNVGDLRRTTNLLMPGVSFERKEADDEIHPRNGWSVFFDVHGAAEPVLSSTTFAQARVATRGVAPLPWRSRLLARFEYGASFVDSFARLPLSERFYAGGDQSVRGYAYQSLGERDEDGNVLGGEYMTAMSLEAEKLLWRSFGVAAFVDAGGAGNEAFPDLSRGVGLGLRYRAPIGSVRVDFAHPLDDRNRGLRLHIGIGVGL